MKNSSRLNFHRPLQLKLTLIAFDNLIKNLWHSHFQLVLFLTLTFSLEHRIILFIRISTKRKKNIMKWKSSHSGRAESNVQPQKNGCVSATTTEWDSATLDESERGWKSIQQSLCWLYTRRERERLSEGSRQATTHSVNVERCEKITAVPHRFSSQYFWLLTFFFSDRVWKCFSLSYRSLSRGMHARKDEMSLRSHNGKDAISLSHMRNTTRLMCI